MRDSTVSTFGDRISLDELEPAAVRIRSRGALRRVAESPAPLPASPAHALTKLET
jgi:hypothetical protein